MEWLYYSALPSYCLLRPWLKWRQDPDLPPPGLALWYDATSRTIRLLDTTLWIVAVTTTIIGGGELWHRLAAWAAASPASASELFGMLWAG